MNDFEPIYDCNQCRYLVIYNCFDIDLAAPKKYKYQCGCPNRYYFYGEEQQQDVFHFSHKHCSQYKPK